MYCCFINSSPRLKTGIKEIPVQQNNYWACSGKTSHTVKYCQTHICTWQSNLSKQMGHMKFQSSTFFLSLSHSIKAIFVFLKSACYFGENFSSVFFHSGSTSPSLFLPSEPRKPLCQREFTFSHTKTNSNIFKWSIWK